MHDAPRREGRLSITTNTFPFAEALHDAERRATVNVRTRSVPTTMAISTRTRTSVVPLDDAGDRCGPDNELTEN